MEKLQKGALNVTISIIIIVLVGLFGYLLLSRRASTITQVSSSSNIKPNLDETIYLSTRYYFGSDPKEPIIGAQIMGYFNSRELLEQYLSMNETVAEYNGKTISLYDIFVSMDAGGIQNNIFWKVAGPESVIKDYLKTIKSGADDHSVFNYLDYNIVPIKQEFD